MVRTLPRFVALTGLVFSALWLQLPALFAADEPAPTPAAEPTDAERLRQLEATVRDLSQTVQALQAGRSGAQPSAAAREAHSSRITFGMYGEIHANFVEGANGDKADIHRFVIELGYEVADWIQFNSEVELEHAFVEDANGEIVIEQCYFDFLLDPRLNARVGRVLIPVGILNTRHTPTTFNGVERTFFDQVIVPTTWFSEGLGVYGTLLPQLKYQAYLVAGLDASGFSDLNGIRGGRQEERPGLHQAAFTARLDAFPLAKLAADLGNLRVGLSTFQGGANNGNDGTPPNLDVSMALYSADLEYNFQLIDLRAAIAYTRIYGASRLTGVAAEILGWNAEIAAHLMPAALKTGRLAQSDLILFLRLDDYDTQHTMPTGVARNKAGDRTAVTFGVTVLILTNLAVKADYQLLDDATTADLNDLMNFGLAWSF